MADGGWRSILLEQVEFKYVTSLSQIKKCVRFFFLAFYCVYRQNDVIDKNKYQKYGINPCFLLSITKVAVK